MLNHSDNFSKTLQSTSMSTAEGQKIANITIRTLKSICSDEKFVLFWTLTKQKASKLDINEPVLPRQRKRPRRYYDGASEGEFFEALDLIVCSIEERFDQPGYKVYSKLEDVLVKGVKNQNYEELKCVVDFYKDDLNFDQISMQLGVLSGNISSDSAEDLKFILCYLQNLSQAERSLL